MCVLFATIIVHTPPETPKQPSDSKQISQSSKTRRLSQNISCNGRLSEERELSLHVTYTLQWDCSSDVLSAVISMMPP